MTVLCIIKVLDCDSPLYYDNPLDHNNQWIMTILCNDNPMDHDSSLNYNRLSYYSG